MPSDNQLKALYERMYAPGHDYQMYRNEIRQILHSRKAVGVGFYRSSVFLNRYKPSPGDRLLEIGCGVGTFLLAAHRTGWQVEGIDISETALAASREVHHLPVRQGNFDDLLFDEGVFRVVACWEVMEHLAHPAQFLARVRPLLRPDGVLVCSVPNNSSRSRVGSRVSGAGPPLHLNFWDEGSLRAFFTVNGWRPIRVVVPRSMLSTVNPLRQPMKFALRQAGALIGMYEGPHLYAVAAPAEAAVTA